MEQQKSKVEDEQIEEFDSDEEDEPESKKPKTDDYSQHLSYEGDLCIYTEPDSGKQMIWDKDKNSWVPRETKNESISNQYEFDGKNYVYTDKTTNITYKFDNASNSWLKREEAEGKSEETGESKETKETEKKEDVPVPPAQGIYGFENDTHTYTDPSDGMSYIWDKEKSAWFPKVKKEIIFNTIFKLIFQDLLLKPHISHYFLFVTFADRRRFHG